MEDHEALEVSPADELAATVTDSSVGWRRATDTLSWTPDTIQPFTFTNTIQHISLVGQENSTNTSKKKRLTSHSTYLRYFLTWYFYRS